MDSAQNFLLNVFKRGEINEKKLLKNAHKTLYGLKHLLKGKKLSHLPQKLGNRK